MGGRGTLAPRDFSLNRLHYNFHYVGALKNYVEKHLSQ